jgi:hypothetical protein
MAEALRECIIPPQCPAARAPTASTSRWVNPRIRIRMMVMMMMMIDDVDDDDDGGGGGGDGAR